jgi:hypothetical protein
MTKTDEMSPATRELYELRKAKGLVPYDPREWLGVPPGVEAPLSIVDQLIARGRQPDASFGAETGNEGFMGEVDGEEL